MNHATELVEVFVTPGVPIDIDVNYPSQEGAAGRFVVKGPRHVRKTLQYVAQGIDDDEIDGGISPRSPVTLPEQVKKEAGIPLAATSFAFINPLPYFKRRLSRINLASDTWGFVFLLGGFAYFDDDNTIIGINALSIVPSPTVLHLIGPSTPTQAVTEVLGSLGRMADVVVDGLVD